MLFHVAGLYSGKIVFSVSQVRITLYPSFICILFHDLYSSYLPCGVIVFSQIGAHLYSRSPGLPGGPLLCLDCGWNGEYRSCLSHHETSLGPTQQNMS